MTPERRAELRKLLEAVALPLHQQRSHLAGKTVDLKREHWVLGSATTLQGLGLIFGSDDRLARLIVAAINALPALLDALDAAEGATGWQPMETAPKDVTVLAFGDGPAIRLCTYLCLWLPGSGHDSPTTWRCPYSLHERWPTHWRPLPAPPPEGRT